MSTTAHRPRILVVEEDRVVAADLEGSLAGLGYEVVAVADSGAEALQSAGHLAPDVVLMDIGLPGSMDGIAAATEIRKRWNIPVVFVTASTSEETLLRASAAGPYGYLVKPIRTKELKAAILVAVQQHRLVRELFSEQTWMRTMLQSLSDSVIATDAQGRVRYINPAGEALLGYSLEEAMGKPIEDIYRLTTPSNEPVEACQLRKALLTRSPVGKCRFLLRSRAGPTVPIEDAASPIESGGELMGAVAVFVDISDDIRKEYEQELERGRLEDLVQVTTQALGETRAELQVLSGRLMAAQEEERRRVARELHDDLGQRATVADIELDRIASLVDSQNETAHQLIRTVRQRLNDLSTSLREMSHRLHPSVVEDLGLAAALGALVDEYRQNGGDASFAARNGRLPDLPLEVSTALYRIAQEALRNVYKHAEGAPVRVALEYAGAKELRLRIEDAGPGFDLNRVRGGPGLGLLSMQERARLAGGSLVLRTRPGHGTLVLVRVPVLSRG